VTALEKTAASIKAEILRHAEWFQDYGDQGFEVDSGYSVEDLRRIAEVAIKTYQENISQ